MPVNNDAYNQPAPRPGQVQQYPDYMQYGPSGPGLNQAARDDQVRQYIQQTLGDYQNLNPYAGSQADMASQGRQTQLSAMGNLGGLLANGWDPQAREMQRQALNKSNEATAGNQGALLQQAQMGGGATGPGSSAAQAVQAASSQGGANAGAAAGRQAQADAMARRLQALGAYGSLAGAIRGGDINSGEQGFQNQLQQFGGMSAARNSLANYYTNQLNQGAAQNAGNWQTALGMGGMALGGYGALSGMGGNPAGVGYSTDYGAGGLLPMGSQYQQNTPYTSYIPPEYRNP
jgi:hypothetical protein